MNHTTTTDTQMAAKHGNNSKLVYANNWEVENLDEITQVLAEMAVSPLAAWVKRIRSAIRLGIWKGPKAFLKCFSVVVR